MAWGFVQGAAPASTNGAGTNHDVAFGSNVTAGNRIVVVAEINENTGSGTGGALTISTASGTATLGTWRQVVQTSNLAAGSFSCLGAIWTAPVTGSGSLTVRAAGGNAANTWQIASAIVEYSGLDPTDALSAVDVSATSVWNPATFQIQSPATNFANELVVGGYFSDGATNTITAGSGFAHLEFSGNSNISEAASEDEDSGAAGSQPTVTWTGATNADKATAVAVFKLPAVAGGASIGAINPGRTWRRQFWRGLQHPFPGAPSSGPIVNVVTASDTLSALTDVATRAAQASVRTASDTLGALTDTATRSLQNFTRTATDSLSAMSDTATRAAQASMRTAADTLAALSDTATRAVQTFTRTASDSLGALTDVATRAAQQATRTASDSLAALTDTATRSLQNFVRTASDTLAALSDQAFKAGQHSTVTAADTLAAMSDTATRAGQQAVRTASDSLASLTDVATRAAQHFLRSVADTIAALLDIATRGGGATGPGTVSAYASVTFRVGAYSSAAFTVGAYASPTFRVGANVSEV